MPPETTLQQLIALLSAHSWLPLIAIATLYLRKVLSPASGFPITIPPRWLPVVTSTGALASGLVSSLQAGESVGAAILGMAVMAASGGLLDGLLTAIFDHDNAPAWARAIVFVFDDIGGGGPGGKPAKRLLGGAAFGHPETAPTMSAVIADAAKPTPPAATRSRRVALVLVSMLAIVLGGCSLLKSPSPQTATDVTIGVNAAACVAIHGADDWAAGMSPSQIVADLVKQCGLSIAQIATLFDARAYESDKLGDTKATARHRALADAARSSDGSR
jgi:hypothetical protein